MTDKITIVIEAKTTPAEAKAKQVQLTGLLSLFIGELGADPAVIDESLDTYITTPKVIMEEGRAVTKPGKATTECRVRSQVTVEVGS